MVGREIENEIPKSDYFYYFYGKEGNKIHFEVEPTPNNNDKNYLDEILETIYENLKEGEIRPCVGFHSAPRHYTPT